MKKPSTIEEYAQWMKHQFHVNNLGALKLHYERESNSIKDQFSNFEFWKDLVRNLQTFHDEYYLEKKQYLFSNPEIKPILLTKSFRSFLEKSYRINVINNSDNWPNPPNEGWITPDNWFSRTKDIVRTKLVVNYLEGLNYLSSRIKQFSKENNIKFNPIPDARMDGYYAINSYFEGIEFSFMEQKSGFEKTIKMSIELQITTQMQDLMRDLLHKEYEKARLQNVTNLKWVWQYKDDKFSTAYLAHLLHYAEGMIMQIIEKNNDSEEE